MFLNWLWYLGGQISHSAELDLTKNGQNEGHCLVFLTAFAYCDEGLVDYKETFVRALDLKKH